MKRPIPNSYWVEPGKFLAGEYPGGDGEAATLKRLQLFWDAGIRHFFDLTEPGEMPAYWPLLPRGAAYRNFPIPDHSIPRTGQSMQEILAALAAAHADSGGIYVHCRAGIGRTGMTVGCWLRERGAEAGDALAQLNRLWRQSARAASWPSVPETDEQYRYVHLWGGVRSPSGRFVQIGSASGSFSRLQMLDRYRGCLLGLALGDALAGMPPGEGQDAAPLRWADDTAMTLCAADSLLACGGFDGRDQVERYLRWQRDPGASGADPRAALRPSVRNALLRALRSHARFQGSLDPSAIDAAPLVRSAAAALFAASDEAAAAALAGDIARVTHQAPLVVDSCRLFAATLWRALTGQDKAAVIASGEIAGLPLKDEVLRAAAGWAAAPGGRRQALPAILAVLDRAVRSFVRSSDVMAGFARLRATPGADADATLAAYGALAGAWYGEAGLPAVLLARLQGREWIDALAVRLSEGRASAAKVP
ncbi:MAG: ADP-ribosylglycohydrolase family protein [Steroidobacteraceae bacterium]